MWRPGSVLGKDHIGKCEMPEGEEWNIGMVVVLGIILCIECLRTLELVDVGTEHIEGCGGKNRELALFKCLKQFSVAKGLDALRTALQDQSGRGSKKKKILV